MNSKLFEVRDEGTFISVIATRMNVSDSNSEQENYLLRRASYSYIPLTLLARSNSILSCREQATYNPYEWSRGRTMSIAHEYINANWEQLASGDVIDVQHILGEIETKKESERFRCY